MRWTWWWRLGIQLFQGLMAADGLRRLGFEAPASGKKRRYAYPCLDWSERCDHLAGELADQLYLHLVAQGWVRRGAGRDVAVTALGQRKFAPVLAEPFP